MKKGIVLLTVLLVFTLFTTVFAETMVKDSDWWKKAAEPYKGVTIKGISESTPPSRAMMEVAGPQFEELTGIKVEFEVTSWDEMYNKTIQDMQTGSGIYDFVYVEQDIIFAYLDQKWLTNLTPFVGKADITNPDFDMPDFTSFIENLVLLGFLWVKV